MQGIQSITIIGSGNVATHLALRFYKAGITINGVWSKHLENSEELARKCNSKSLTNIETGLAESDLILIAIHDKFVKEIVASFNSKLSVVHTSGSLEKDVLQKFENYGVFYPLQTLTKSKLDSDIKIPILLEGSNPSFQSNLGTLAEKITDQVGFLDSRMRKTLHVAAVMVNNFTNQIYQDAYEHCVANNLDFNLLKPLIIETANRIADAIPAEVQTGPAKRNDQVIIDEHLKMLESNPAVQELYNTITQRIIKTQHEL